MTKYYLIILHLPQFQNASDFLTARNMMYGRAPDIDVVIAALDARLPPDFWQKVAERPTLLFSPSDLRHSPHLGGVNPLLRGTSLIGRGFSKLNQIEMLSGAGLAMPMTTRLRPDTRLDEEQWGPFVVLKPNKSHQGKGISMVRTRDAHWVDPLSWPTDDPRHGDDMLAQQYIHTGRPVTCFRVFSVLGKPLYANASTSTHVLPATDPHGSTPVEIAIAANYGDRSIKLIYDQDVLDFAQAIHESFPELPSMGIDILRQEETGKLFVMEINAAGFSWHLSSNYGLSQQRKYGVDYYNQFGAMAIMTEAFIDATRRLAS